MTDEWLNITLIYLFVLMPRNKRISDRRDFFPYLIINSELCLLSVIYNKLWNYNGTLLVLSIFSVDI